MKKQMNEAQVRIDLNGLESDDLETLSRMLALAGQAERPEPQVSTVPPMAPLDIDSVGGDETQAIMPDIGMEVDEPADDLEDAAAELSGSITDFGDDDESEEDFEMGLDMDGQPSVDFSSSDEDFGEDDFDMNRMSSLAGIQESVESDEEADEEEADEDEKEDEDLGLVESSLLPDLTLDEDSVATTANELNGPFRSERECVMAACQETNGVEGDHFSVVPKGNQFFWKRHIDEDCVDRPEGMPYDTSGIENSRHNIAHKRNALGDNKLLGEEDESLEEIKESIEAKFKKFMGDNNVF